MSKVCPECGREFSSSSSSVRCPICKCDLVNNGISSNSSQNRQQMQSRSTNNIRNYSSRTNTGTSLIRCPDCGRQISSKATTCPGCGHPFGRTKFCKFCGESIPVDSIVCPKCGRQVESVGGNQDKSIVINNNNVNNNAAVASAGGISGLISPKSRLVALLLCLFLGIFGIHRFYVGKIGTGILMIFLMFTGIGEIWLIIDFFIILFGGFTDNFGRRIINW